MINLLAKVTTKILLGLIFIFLSNCSSACSMRVSQNFRPSYYEYVYHSSVGKEAVRVPTVKVESIHLNRGLRAVGCPSYIFAELSLPPDSPYTFQELGVYFKLGKDASKKINLSSIPHEPLSILDPKRAIFLVIFNLKEDPLYFIEPFEIEIFAINNLAEIGDSNFANAIFL